MGSLPWKKRKPRNHHLRGRFGYGARKKSYIVLRTTSTTATTQIKITEVIIKNCP
jgi:hypothetical protein